ncbi:MAG: hypothetical protein PVI91_03850 [Gammaproteobacteria bacterium]|jgi:hypothetical protein
MAKAQRKRNGTRSNRKRARDNDQDQERLKILRLDLNTILEQIRILDQELEVDSCLSQNDIAVILSLAENLRRELEGTRVRIRELKSSVAG